MKIIEKNCIYIQKKDINFLLEVNKDTPLTVIKEISKNIHLPRNLDNIQEFVKIEDKNAVKYLKANKDILNYNDLVNYSIEELILLSRKVATERQVILEKIKLLHRRGDNSIEIPDYKVINYKMEQIKYIMIYKQLINQIENKKYNTQEDQQNIFDKIIR